MNKKAKIAVIITSIILVIIALTTSTYALFTSQQRAANKSAYTTGLLSVSATSKTNSISLSGELPKSDDEGISGTPYTFTITNNGNLDYKFDIKLMSTSDNPISSNYIKIKIDDNNITTLSQLSNNIIKENVVLSAGQSIDVSIRIWLSSSTPNTEIGKSFNSKIVTDGQAIYTNNDNDVTAVALISNKYNPNIVVTNNNIKYNYDVNNSMMKDAAGNLRYYGASPNNYIYFNCDDYNEQTETTCELWRIIGVFNNKLKIVRNDSIGSLAWDQQKNINPNSSGSSNNWETSSIKNLLNGKYYNRGDTTTLVYYSNLDGSATTTIDLQAIGIKDSTRNLISKSTWYLGGNNNISKDSRSYSNNMYEFEHGEQLCLTCTNATVEDYIGLMYPSDYGYAADFTKCKNSDSTSDLNLFQYNTDINNYQCRTNDWLYKESDIQWLITQSPEIGETPMILVIYSNGQLLSTTVAYKVYTSTRPTLYLNANTKIDKTGDGSIANPYRIQY